MCGIAGILGELRPGDDAVVGGMLSVLRHRGPDAGRSTSLAGATLGFRRLSVIDLADRAMQPMRSRRSGCVLVFNGEIYNYRELRAALSPEYAFETESDTEVLLAAWDRWGEDCLRRLNGMFAFCVYDPAAGRAFLARDRFGQKPLFLAQHGGRLHFASEVKALIAAGIERRPDLSVWSRYLLSASYDDGIDSFFAGVSQLAPGECAVWCADGTLTRRRYYDVADAVHGTATSVAEAAARTRALLVDSARLHMRSDVPVGISLSGGLDSSALLASLALAGQLNDAVQCVSVDFGGDLSERPWIEAAAGFHGLTASVQGYSPERFAADIRPLMWHLEGPLGGLMNCALIAVMQAARSAGIVVVQDGTGLDESFGGYRNHHDLHLGLLLANQTPTAAQALADYAANWGVSEADARASAARAMSSEVTAIDGTRAVRPELLNAGFVARHRPGEQPPGSRPESVHAALVDYLQVRKIPRNTRMKDRLSMAFGLELRLPFLDHRLVEHALSLPPEHYFLHGRSKSIVREALAGAMDDGVRLAAKRSIQAPQGAWLRREPMRSYVSALIGSESFADRGLFEPAKVRAAFERFVAGEYDNSFFVWQWINVEEWFRIFVDASPLAQPLPLCPDFAVDLPMAAAAGGGH